MIVTDEAAPAPTLPTLEQDVEALAAELTDPEEARALVALLELATAADWQPGQDDGYRPFVYPH